MPPHPQTTRQKILDVAGSLFFRQGFRAVGVDLIAEQTGMSKMTLYRHFESKDELIIAYLEQVNQSMQQWLDDAIRPYPDQPKEQLLAIFAALQKLVTSPLCFGCSFLITAAEFPELDSASHQAAVAHKRSILARFRALAQLAGAPQPDQLADQLLLLMDGAFSAVRMFGSNNPGSNVQAAARALIEAKLR